MPLLDPHMLDRLHLRRATRSLPGETQRELLRRAALLLPPDRTLVKLVVEDGVSRRRLAEVLRVPAGCITRRLQRLGARLHDPLVIALLRDDCPLQPDYRQLGVEHFLQGRPMRELAELHEMSLSEVRRILSFIRGWHGGISGAARR